MMRLQLEDYVYVSAPCPRKDILVMEAVQQSFTRWTPEMVKLYEEWLHFYIEKFEKILLKHTKFLQDLTEVYVGLMFPLCPKSRSVSQ